MKTAKISMPHRHTVRFEEDDLILDFEVELLSNGIVLYENSPQVVSGKSPGSKEQAMQVADWLKSKFQNVEVDQS